MMAPSFIAPAALRNENPETPSTPSACFYYDSLTRLHISQTASRKPRKAIFSTMGSLLLNGDLEVRTGGGLLLDITARCHINFFQPRTNKTDKVGQAASQGIMHFP
jgi:hypothetical protein